MKKIRTYDNITAENSAEIILYMLSAKSRRQGLVVTSTHEVNVKNQRYSPAGYVDPHATDAHAYRISSAVKNLYDRNPTHAAALWAGVESILENLQTLDKDGGLGPWGLYELFMFLRNGNRSNSQRISSQLRRFLDDEVFSDRVTGVWSQDSTEGVKKPIRPWDIRAYANHQMGESPHYWVSMMERYPLEGFNGLANCDLEAAKGHVGKVPGRERHYIDSIIRGLERESKK